jgi:hypothetical protein
MILKTITYNAIKMTLPKAMQLEFGRGLISIFQKTSRAITIILRAKKTATPKTCSKKKVTEIKEESKEKAEKEIALITKRNKRLVTKKTKK